jgi:rhodanese-related sulfurtransferase
VVDALPAEIDCATLADLRMQGASATVVDVREPWEREICSLDHSVGIPLGELPRHLEDLPANGPLVLLCHHGVRSLQAAVWLRRQGFAHAVSLRGGIDAWADEMDPSMRRY